MSLDTYNRTSCINNKYLKYSYALLRCSTSKLLPLSRNDIAKSQHFTIL